jgi:HSP20 family protein
LGILIVDFGRVIRTEIANRQCNRHSAIFNRFCYDPPYMSWDPMRDLRAWQERLASPRADAWAPPIDVYETADRYVVAAEVPGMTREQIELALEDSRLIISGHRTDKTAASGTVTHFHQVERGHGAFERSLEFASKIDTAAVSADLTLGVLTITLPKAAPPPLRKIEVR